MRNPTIRLTERDASWIANRLVDFSYWGGVPLNRAVRLERMAEMIYKKIQKNRKKK